MSTQRIKCQDGMRRKRQKRQQQFDNEGTNTFFKKLIRPVTCQIITETESNVVTRELKAMMW